MRRSLSAQLSLSECRRLVEEAAARHDPKKLFGDSRLPNRDMLGVINRSFNTYLTKIKQNQDQLPHIPQAFGGRGAVIVHATFTELERQTRTPQRRKTVEVVEKSELVILLRGEPGPFGDSRRVFGEPRFKKMGPCGTEFVGDALVVPSNKEDPLWATHEIARVFASLDFDGYQRLIQEGYVDDGTFLPALELSIEKNQEENEQIEKSFVSAQEAQKMRSFVPHDIEKLEMFERTLMPLAYVPSLVKKVRLFVIKERMMEQEEMATGKISSAIKACENVVNSNALLDLLFVMLQIATYLANFGSSVVDGQGFSFSKIQEYANFKVGKFSFLYVVCPLLMNLRPGGEKGPTAKTPRGRNSEMRSPRSQNKESDETPSRKARRSTIKRVSFVDPEAARRAAEAIEPSFLEKLEHDLREAREVVQNNASMSDLEQMQGELDNMARMVRHIIGEPDEEIELFHLERSEGEPPISNAERFAELECWTEGRDRLKQLYDRVQGTTEKLGANLTLLKQRERDLQEFAALKPSEFAVLGFLDIIKTLVSFVDKFKAEWMDIASKSSVKLLRITAAAEPLGLLFGCSSQRETFEFWRQKMDVFQPKTWSAQVKQTVVEMLFKLFDLDGTGAIDAAELQVVLAAFGVVLPESKQLHIDFIQRWDASHTGKLNMEDFQRFIETRTAELFTRFADPQKINSDTIDQEDLRRVADELKLDVSDSTLQAMIAAIDTNRDGLIRRDEFEQLVLIKHESKGLEVGSVRRLEKFFMESDSESDSSSCSDSD